MAGGYCCYFYWSQNGGEWCGIGAAALMTMMIIVTITVVIVEGRLLLPTGSEFSLSFPWLLSVLAEVPSLYLHCCYRCCCCIVVVICVVASLLFLLLSLSAGVIFVVFVFRFRYCYWYLRRFRFSFSLLSRCQHRFAPFYFGLVASPLL